MMKKLLLFLMLVVSFNMNAQLTSLTIDNQTPGWLSSKINYGDQQTLENIRVTGYIDGVDLSFISTLMEKYSLHGHVDLTDVTVVNTSYVNNQSSTNFDNMFSVSKLCTLRRLSLPTSLKFISSYLLAKISADTLDFGSDSCNTLTRFLVNNAYHSSNRSPKVLILREGVKKIERYSVNSNDQVNNLLEVVLPGTLDSIGDYAFYQCKNLSKIKLGANISSIGSNAFTETSFLPDTLDVPYKIKTYYTNSFEKKQGQVIDLKENVEFFDNESWYVKESDNITYVIHREEPPVFRKGHLTNSGSLGTELSSCTLYVPKEGYSMYSDPKYNSVGGNYWSNWANPYSYATVKTIYVGVDSLQLSQNILRLVVGNSSNLTVTISPSNADNKDLIWTSSDPNIVNVNNDGLVTAIASGQANIIVTSIDNPQVQATCQVTVFQPVTNVNLYKHELDLKVGQSETLRVDVLPVNADDKSLTWKSENDSIAIVDERGKITGLASGKVKIYAISNDNNKVMDYCEVTVTQPVSGLKLNYSKYEIKGIGSTVKLEATVIPEDATNKEVRWVSSNDAVCMVSAGNVVATGLGTAVIIATTVEGGYMATCTITVVEGQTYPTGDVNEDGVVDVADVNAVINMMLHLQETNNAADVNDDGIIDVADLNMIINKILGI